MNTDFSELTLMQLSDSFFPSGLYTLSNGLETIFDEKRASSEGDVYDFLEVTLEQQLGPADSVALSNAYDCAKSKDISGIIRCDNVLYSMKLIQESRAASCRAGSQMLKCIVAISSDSFLKSYSEKISKNDSPGTHPVVAGVCSFAMGIKKEQARQMMMYGFCVSTTGAALRLGMIDHIQSQKILHKIKPKIQQTLEKFVDTKINDCWQFSPQYDLIQMTHENKFSKMFIT
ncbi:MAG: urease accessory protein [Thaumarchaeota archaeon]|jgi:urease accessory protein|nr:urease accessory protein [Nitrososphaerota archaeon]MBT4057897.1 urease accessory protein [Nitrososphaerota archaeon]MBT4175644.1 urease accessory protein [Nitrososphaerota archaeon]MBT4510390.1 urease accessory protein [Nitrososphaerota archaeon]MBT4674977.1 urease accessory protein [Nitrososphaerota archaeon]